MTLAEQFGLNVARARIAAGYSQEELGVRSSLHRTAVGQIERGERTPRLDTVLRLAGSLGLPPSNLLAGLPDWTPGGTLIGRFADRGLDLL